MGFLSGFSKVGFVENYGLNGSKQRRLPNYTCKVKTAKQCRIDHDGFTQAENFSMLFTRDCRHVVHQLCGFRSGKGPYAYTRMGPFNTIFYSFTWVILYERGIPRRGGVKYVFDPLFDRGLFQKKGCRRRKNFGVPFFKNLTVFENLTVFNGILVVFSGSTTKKSK